MKLLHLLDPNFVVFGPYIYMIPTVFLYMLLIYLILLSEHRKKFSFAFYKIFVLKAAASIICVVTFEICFRLPDAPAAASVMRLLPPTGVFPKSLFVICYHSGTVMFLMEGVMSFNRATTILLSTRHNAFWTRAMPWIYIVSAVFPLTFTWSLFFVNVTLYPDDINDGSDDRSFKMEDAPVSQDTATFYILIALALLSLWNIVWNLYTLSYLVQRKVRALRASSNAAKVVCDTRQFIFSFLTFLIELFTILVTVSLVYEGTGIFDMTYSPFLYFLLDACHCMPAWLIVCMNIEIRTMLIQQVRTIFRMTCCRGRNASGKVTVLTNTKNRINSK